MNYSSNTCQEQSFYFEPMFFKNVVFLIDMDIQDKQHPKTVIYFVSNLKYLLLLTGITKKELADKSHVSARYIDYILNYQKYPSIEIAENIAKGFGLEGWHMILPSLNYELGKNGKLNSLLKEFSESTKVTQDYVSEVLHKKII